MYKLIQHIRAYTSHALVACLLALSACSSRSSYDWEAEAEGPNRATLQVVINTNSGGNQVESQLQQIRLLLIDTETERCVINQLMTLEGSSDLSTHQGVTQLHMDPIRVLPGTYETVLVANENSTITDLSAYRTALQAVRAKADFHQQALRAIPYTPDETHQLAPQGPLLFSAYIPATVIDTGTFENPQRLSASLVAALAQLEVVFLSKKTPGDREYTSKRVTSLSLLNLGSAYTNPGIAAWDDPSLAVAKWQLPVQFSPAQYQRDSIGALLFYVPERLYPAEQEVPRPSIVKIQGKGFSDHSFPLKPHTSEQVTQDFQRHTRLWGSADTQLNPHSLLRNIRYQLRISLTRADKEIASEWRVLPWTTVESQRDFEAPEAHLTFAPGIQEAASNILLVPQQEACSFTLRITGSQGANWRVSLSNGLDFALRPAPNSPAGSLPATQGAVDTSTTYAFEVVPLKPFQGLPRYTELLLLVDGKEVELPINKPNDLPAGAFARYLIKQVEKID